MSGLHLLITAPTHGASVKLPFPNSLPRTREMLAGKGIRHAFPGAAMRRSLQPRNFLASFMLEQEAFTHLLFIAAYMAFSPDFSFRERIVRTGDECRALASETVHHVGDFPHGGSYTDHLAARRL